MMNAVEFARTYFNFCEAIGEKPENVLVSAGGALLMLGLRESSDDLDLDVRDVVYDAVATRKPENRWSGGAFIDYDEHVSIHRKPPGVKPMVVQGVTLYSLEDLIKQKEKMVKAPDRKPEKVKQDNKDIEALKELRRKQR